MKCVCLSSMISNVTFPTFPSDPYVKVEMYVNGIREGKHKTKVRQNTQDPVWHHQCVFEINRENPKLLGHVFVFHMLHKDMMTGVHKIGQVRQSRTPVRPHFKKHSYT